MSILKYAPSVFAVGREYQISIRVSAPCIMWIEVGSEKYYDDSNGILRSNTTFHKISVPQAELDAACGYTVCYRRVIDRKPYFPLLEDEAREVFRFKPVKSSSPKAYHIADAHGNADGAVASARKYVELFGDIDFLILNGDIIDHSGDVNNFDVIYDISSRLAGGEIPVVFSRGNHDTRGFYAENIADYTPTRDGLSYFTFRLGGIWGIVLDCAEDKMDDHPEYGGTIACHAFRVRETQYIEDVIKRADEEYLADGVTHRIAVAHVPFTDHFKPPFNIEEDIYRRWTRLLSDEIGIDMMICGHLHELHLYTPGSENDYYGQSFPVAVVSRLDRKTGRHTGGGFTFGDEISIDFVNESGRLEVVG